MNPTQPSADQEARLDDTIDVISQISLHAVLDRSLAEKVCFA